MFSLVWRGGKLLIRSRTLRLQRPLFLQNQWPTLLPFPLSLIKTAFQSLVRLPDSNSSLCAKLGRRASLKFRNKNSLPRYLVTERKISTLNSYSKIVFHFDILTSMHWLDFHRSLNHFIAREPASISFKRTLPLLNVKCPLWCAFVPSSKK